MRTAALLALGAGPSLAVGYFLLVAYLLNRVRPLPISFFPDVTPVEASPFVEPAAQDAGLSH